MPSSPPVPSEEAEVPPDGAQATPFDRIGGDASVRALVERFYDAMTRLEPVLAALHSLDDEGRVNRGTRDRFALFLSGWLGGPQHYVARHGHPRLRMRHGAVPIDTTMRDAWLRCMSAAMDESEIRGQTRRFLEMRLGEVADFLRNREG